MIVKQDRRRSALHCHPSLVRFGVKVKQARDHPRVHRLVRLWDEVELSICIHLGVRGYPVSRTLSRLLLFISRTLCLLVFAFLRVTVSRSLSVRPPFSSGRYQKLRRSRIALLLSSSLRLSERIILSLWNFPPGTPLLRAINRLPLRSTTL
jgi:hypothetical protein